MSALNALSRRAVSEPKKRGAAKPNGVPRHRGTSPSIAPADAPDARFSRATWLRQVLADRVVDGTYAPGEHIREALLQEEFGFSNGPVREALQQLVADGLAERAPWRGVCVVKLDERQIICLFELRAALLEYASELAARRADDAAIESAQALLKSLAKKFNAARTGRLLPVTGDTTEWVMSVAKNPFIAEVWRTTMLRSRIYVYRSMKQTAGAHTEPIIAQLIDAIIRKKPAAARKAARALTHRMLADLGIGTESE